MLWHGVESLGPVSILVNYWWTDHDPALGAPYAALLHNLLAFRHLPPADRAIWRAMLDHYVFEANRSEEHTSELQSLMRISYAVFCLKKKKTKSITHHNYAL